MVRWLALAAADAGDRIRRAESGDVRNRSGVRPVVVVMTARLIDAKHANNSNRPTAIFSRPHHSFTAMKQTTLRVAMSAALLSLTFAGGTPRTGGPE